MSTQIIKTQQENIGTYPCNYALKTDFASYGMDK